MVVCVWIEEAKRVRVEVGVATWYVGWCVVCVRLDRPLVRM